MNTGNTVNTLNWDDINAAIFDRLDTALPEFEFKQYGTGWQSCNVTKLDGRQGKTPGQVQCNRPGLLADHSDGTYLQYWDYIQQRDNLDNTQTAAILRQLAGVNEGRPLTAEQIRQYQQQARAAAVWELFIEYTKQQLHNNPEPDSEQYQQIKKYITQQRKYTMQDCEIMELGLLNADWHKAIEYIQSKSPYTTDDINEIIQCNRSAIGHSHKLIIPIRSRTGKAEGIAARNINWKPEDKNGKYLYNTGIKKANSIHGLPYRAKNGRAVIVEGQLDAAITLARGYDAASVGALGGKSISQQQINCLLQSKAHTVVICLDNEPATVPDIRKAIEQIRQHDTDSQIADRIYIAKLPDGVKDIDELLTQHADGMQQFVQAIDSPEMYNKWLAQIAINTFDNSAKTDIDHTQMLEAIVNIASQMDSMLHRGEMLDNFKALANGAGLPITNETLEDAAQQIRERDDEKKQDIQLAALNKKAEDIRATDGPAASIKYIQDNLRNIQMRSRRAEFDKMYNSRLTEDIVKKRSKNKPKGARIGYSMQANGNTEKLEAPAGQLTFIAARTGHGKTKTMLNIALNILQEPQRSVHFFTYEMDDISILRFALNIFIGVPISNNNRKSIDTYFTEGTDKYIADRETFKQKKDAFFTEYINTGRLNFYHADHSADEVIQYIKHIKKHDNDAVIIIDYIQKMRSDRKGNADHRQTELKLICDDLETCAVNTGVPIILAAQFNRQVNTPLDMAPTVLAEASDIEKCASEVYGVFDCNQYLMLDKAPKNEINNKYGIEYGNRDDKVILEILKSRLYGQGHYTVLNSDWNSGTLKQEPTISKSTEQIKYKPLPIN